MPLCAGKSRATGQPCKNNAEEPTKFCRFHGSRSLRGPNHPWYKHGRYSTAAPERMQDDLIRLAEDEKLLELNDELALLKARALDMLKRADSGESGVAWKALQKEARALRAALRADEPNFTAIAIKAETILQIALEGGADWDTWHELQATILNVTRVAESQRKYRLEEQQMISLDAAYALMASLVDVVRRTVPDERVIDRVTDEFERIASAQSYKQAPAAAGGFSA